MGAVRLGVSGNQGSPRNHVPNAMGHKFKHMAGTVEVTELGIPPDHCVPESGIPDKESSIKQRAGVGNASAGGIHTNEGSEDVGIGGKPSGNGVAVNLSAQLKLKQADNGLEHKGEGVGVRAQGGELNGVEKRDGAGGGGGESVSLDHGVVEINSWLMSGWAVGEDGRGVI